jgi:hypothetical protein
MGEVIKRESREFKRNLKRLAQLIFFLIAAYLLFIYLFTRPSHDRDWKSGFEIMPSLTIDVTKVKINNLRDYIYTSSNSGETKYKNVEVDINNLERAWFISEPFVIKPFTNFGGVAHTYFVFDFKDSPPIAVSVEARREKGEQYDAWKGLLNSYELFYVWGTETDETVRRVIDQENPLYMYPLTISKDSAQKLFLQLAESTITLEKTPRFYNTFSSNCTNELAKNANNVQENTISMNNRALYFPGYADEELYKLGFIPTDIPLSEVSEKYNITEKVKSLYMDNEFSKKLREEL